MPGQAGVCGQEGGLGSSCRARSCVQGAALLGSTATTHSPSGASASSSLQVPKDLEVLLRATFFGTIFMQV